jgi:hypothetical protein
MAVIRHGTTRFNRASGHIHSSIRVRRSSASLDFQRNHGRRRRKANNAMPVSATSKTARLALLKAGKAE